ncbi:Heat shock factor protein [Exaiptasia diaphana]|nr:Heat shock factor protein [Exaiptasia diaphana]
MNLEPNRFHPLKGKPLSPFISKLKALLSDERFRRAIKWCENGCAIVISDGETFKKLVLDQSEEMKMFKTRNFTSFVRQLNLYGFKKVPVNGKADPSKNMKFEHQNFKRENPELMHLVHRTCNPRKNKKVNRSAKTHFTKRTAVLHSTRKRRYNCYSDECVGPDAENSDSETSSITSSDSRSTTPNKVYFASPSPFEPPAAVETAATEQYMYQKLQEEQMVVQLLLSLKNTSPMALSTPSSCEDFQASTSDPVCAPPYNCFIPLAKKAEITRGSTLDLIS